MNYKINGRIFGNQVDAIKFIMQLAADDIAITIEKQTVGKQNSRGLFKSFFRKVSVPQPAPAKSGFYEHS